MTAAPEEPRQASTMVLVREHESGFQVYLLKRSGQSGFFPGNYVFPGGAVASEDRDADLWLRHSDIDLPGVDLRLGGTLPAMEKGAVILEPWDPMIHEKAVEFDPAALKKLVLPAGAPFSRLWLYEGIWRPVGA